MYILCTCHRILIILWYDIEPELYLANQGYFSSIVFTLVCCVALDNTLVTWVLFSHLKVIKAPTHPQRIWSVEPFQ